MATQDEMDRASRLARAIASDISIYYGDKIKRGLENDTLFEEIADELKEAVTLFQQKVPPDIVANTNTLEKALIDILVAGRGQVRTRIF
jgi:hypothetical protein